MVADVYVVQYELWDKLPPPKIFVQNRPYTTYNGYACLRLFATKWNKNTNENVEI